MVINEPFPLTFPRFSPETLPKRTGKGRLAARGALVLILALPFMPRATADTARLPPTCENENSKTSINDTKYIPYNTVTVAVAIRPFEARLRRPQTCVPIPLLRFYRPFRRNVQHYGYISPRCTRAAQLITLQFECVPDPQRPGLPT